MALPSSRGATLWVPITALSLSLLLPTLQSLGARMQCRDHKKKKEKKKVDVDKKLSLRV